jgi:hypothetical protein
MRIFVQLPEIGGSHNNIAQQAHEILRQAGSVCAPVGGIVDDEGVAYVDLAGPFSALNSPGLRAMAEST